MSVAGAPRPLRLPPAVRQRIRSLHPLVRRRVRAALDRLRAEPGAGKALGKELAGWRTWRAGRLRIVYRETPGAIEVAAIGPRAAIYAETASALQRARTEGGG